MKKIFAKQFLAVVMVFALLLGSVGSFAAAKPSTTFKKTSDIYGIYMDSKNYNYIIIDKNGLANYYRNNGGVTYSKMDSAPLKNLKLSKDKKMISVMFGDGQEGFTYYYIFSKDKKGNMLWQTEYGDEPITVKYTKFKSVADLQKSVKGNKTVASMIAKEKVEIQAQAELDKKYKESDAIFGFDNSYKGQFDSADGCSIIFGDELQINIKTIQKSFEIKSSALMINNDEFVKNSETGKIIASYASGYLADGNQCSITLKVIDKNSFTVTNCDNEEIMTLLKDKVFTKK